MSRVAYLLVNFGGPRNLPEIEEFLIELLTDQEVIRTPFPAFLHRILFTRVAKKRVDKVSPDYALIGGKSPIFEDTETIAKRVGTLLNGSVVTFHRYLPKTHGAFIAQMKALDAEEIRLVPLFPQFSYATTGSIAKWFSKKLPKEVVRRMKWVKSYADHPSYIDSLEQCLRNFLQEKNVAEREAVFLFSAHGLPQKFVDTGDPYQKECEESFVLLKRRFPEALSFLSYQSQFGKEQWICPSTESLCEEIDKVCEGRKNVVIIPLSFTSDHIETLYEIEKLYLPLIEEKRIQALRCPALNLREDWLQTIAELFQISEGVPNNRLLRNKNSAHCIKD